MAVDGFNEICNVVYVAKKLYDIGKYELVTESFFDALDYDVYYENMYTLIGNIFDYGECQYSECRGTELYILSDKVIVDFYILAGKYGRRRNIPDEENPYILAAQQEARENFNISHCLDWKLVGHTEPKRPFHSRLALFIYQDDYVDVGVLAYRLVELYEWFAERCGELRVILEPLPGQMNIEEAIAA